MHIRYIFTYNSRIGRSQSRRVFNSKTESLSNYKLMQGENIIIVCIFYHFEGTKQVKAEKGYIDK